MTALIKMANDVQDRVEAFQGRLDEKGAVSIEYLAIAVVVATLLTFVGAAVSAGGGSLAGHFTKAVNDIFSK